MSISERLQKHWQKSCWYLSIVLKPLAGLFFIISSVRRWLYCQGVLKQKALPVPVIIIGNINIGGVGKTPILIYLVKTLQAQGFTVGVISRGYGRKNKETLLVQQEGQASLFGDEPIMIAKQTNAPVAVSSSRFDAGSLLLKKYPTLDLIISDDGLQHYALKRDLELVVINNQMGFGNGYLMPQGPLRENIQRLNKANALLISDCPDQQHLSVALPNHLPVFYSYLHAHSFYSLHEPDLTQAALAFKNKKIAAVAGIGRPDKFFTTLKQLDLNPTCFAFPDHYAYHEDDLPKGFDVIFTTEKDAVKLKNLPVKNVWVLPVNVTIAPDLALWVTEQLHLA
ncbi:tetraacyldisaccharide 4'-kinase [Neisseria sp. Ec49-e6-T10]|uniref:tetraacyldisaccharide 4'-kinase n=1 Tax=Neisseria sp. Ec49-e6-T10 TaxID=3140744 RepID=UPI003EBACE6F